MFSQKHNNIVTNILQFLMPHFKLLLQCIFAKKEQIMYFILQEMKKIDLGDTPVENIFIDMYMPIADGNYVKVYLMGYKWAKEGQNNFSNSTITRQLDIAMDEVQDAWKYWENLGIIKRHATEDGSDCKIEFLNLKQMLIDNFYIEKNDSNENKASEVDILIDTMKHSDNITMMQDIEEMFCRPLTVNEKQKINKWKSDYGMTTDMMTQAFSYSINNRKIKKFSSIEKVLKDWFDAGVKNLDTMVEYLEKRNDRFSIYSKISRYLGIFRPLDEPSMRIIDKWIDEWKFSMEMIMKCLDKSVNTLNPSFTYFDSIMKSWNEKGFKTVEDLKNDVKPEAKKQAVQNKDTKPNNKFHNFDQKMKNYSEQELEKIARQKLEKKLNKLGIGVPKEGDDENK